MSYQTIEATMYLERDGYEVQVSLSATFIPGSRQTREEPVEEACLEDVTAKLPDGRELTLEDDEEDDAEQALWQAVEGKREDAQVRNHVSRRDE
jgi:hypothetical protein